MDKHEDEDQVDVPKEQAEVARQGAHDESDEKEDGDGLYRLVNLLRELWEFHADEHPEDHGNQDQEDRAEHLYGSMIGTSRECFA